MLFSTLPRILKALAGLDRLAPTDLQNLTITGHYTLEIIAHGAANSCNDG
jgi:hypothetical protein